ncbi:hypothetical protein MMC17_002291 [Xylographa soralifera]|nr:hypothetical protein [Xylographa soralifera]
MAHPQSQGPKPEKPLKILTIDGGGLQAISTLLILDKLLDTIATNNGVSAKKPRPCDVFDTIAGIGAGGWLALFLGRFHMDITACLTEWYNLAQIIAPRSRAEGAKIRLLQHCYYDTGRLVNQIDHLTKVYGTGAYLYCASSESTRCKHVFVAALNTNSSGSDLGYNLFRTYDAPTGHHVKKGPEDPLKFKISSAFGVTGAARYFTSPWKEHIAGGGKLRFLDTKFPKPHNITELALDEMRALYGDYVPLSVVVNIGPGLPNNSDINQIARRFSWGLSPATASRLMISKRARSPASQNAGLGSKRIALGNQEGADDRNKNLESHIKISEPTSGLDNPANALEDGEKKMALNRINSVGSVADRAMDKKLRRLETEIEKKIKKKLKGFYPNDTPPYYRLALEKCPEGTAQNDASAPGLAFDAALEYIERNKPMVNEVCHILAPQVAVAS